MKIPYKHIIENIHSSSPSIDELSEKLFQLGHEHEIEDENFNMEFTPNRGDCLSLNGLLRDLSLFYEVDINNDIYKDPIDKLKLNFVNNAAKQCKQISFLKLEINESNITSYKGKLKNYLDDLNINKNNFFTDVSNYISYETGQPTHCYDSTKIKGPIKLEVLDQDYLFDTLLDKKIKLRGKNLVFSDENGVINLAGIMGGKQTSCSKETNSVIIECAHFRPEDIISKSVKYDIRSDAAYKFERGVDINCQDYVLRRFIKVVEENATITNIQIFSENFLKDQLISIPYDHDLISKILGISITEDRFLLCLSKLGFIVEDNKIIVPSYRNDIKSINDIAEEIARAIGYNNIEPKPLSIPSNTHKRINNTRKIQQLLVDNGFYEVINNPFTNEKLKSSIIVDNPLDKNKPYLRTNLKKSLLSNLLYNERRQKDSIKLFEISDIYCASEKISNIKRIGIIVSGRVGKNYRDFSRKISDELVVSFLEPFVNRDHLIYEEISRDELDTKLKNPIYYFEFSIDAFDKSIEGYTDVDDYSFIFNTYKKISEHPTSYRDLSFSIKDYEQSQVLEKIILNFEHPLLKEKFIFDYFVNEKNKEIKMAFRFIFQCFERTITEAEVNDVIDDIVLNSLKLPTVTLPGYKKQ